MQRAAALVGVLVSIGACGNSGNGDAPPPGDSSGGTAGSLTTGGSSGASGVGGTAGTPATGGISGSGGSLDTGGTSAGGTGGSNTNTGGQSSGAGGAEPGGAGPGVGGASAGTSGGPSGGAGASGGSGANGGSGASSGSGGKGGSGANSGSGGKGGSGASGGSGTSGAAGSGGGSSNCVGKAWTTADPTNAGPFQVTADKNVGPLAGYLPDPIYGSVQQRFNVYRPTNLASSGYCHPILVWANGHGDNPEQHPPECIIDSGANRWCGTYPVLINQLASHGFVVVSSLSTTTSRGEPLPTIIGLNWLLEQSENPASPYYHHLDTARIGALGHSEGGLSTTKAAADPRIMTIATVSGAGSGGPTGLRGPALFICGGQDTVVTCTSVKTSYQTVTTQPAILMNNKSADHGSWLYQNGTKGPDIFALTAWFRVQLMNDTANRDYFYGASCRLCTDSRLTVERNSLVTQ